MVSSNASDKGTKRSHTVCRTYLKEFANGNNLYVKSKKDCKTSKVHIKDASVVSNIYELEESISENDLEFYKSLFFSNAKMTNEDSLFINKIIAFLNNDLEFFIGKQIKGLNSVFHKELDTREVPPKNWTGMIEY